MAAESVLGGTDLDAGVVEAETDLGGEGVDFLVEVVDVEDYFGHRWMMVDGWIIIIIEEKAVVIRENTINNRKMKCIINIQRKDLMLHKYI